MAMHILADPPASAWTGGFVGGLKVSINSHGDSLQPGHGDAVGIMSLIDDQRGRERLWAMAACVSVYSTGPRTAASQEFDVNNLSGVEPDEPGGARSFFGVWVSGSSYSRYMGSAAMYVSAANGKWWRNGLYIDQSEVGIRLGSTMTNALGLDLGRSRLRFQTLTVPPPRPPSGCVEIYPHTAAGGKVQLIAWFPNGSWAILATEQ
jgi:hypothetical protein